MAKNNVRKKPTAKEMASAIIEINNKLDSLYRITRELDSVLGLYVEMKGDKKQFNAYVDKKYTEYQRQMEEMSKKNDKETNGSPDKPNLQGDTDGEGSGTEGIRTESK